MSIPEFNSTDHTDSVPLQNLLRHVLPYVPKVPQAMAMDLLRQRYIDFCRRSRMLCTELVMDYQSGVRDYYLQAPDDHEVYLVVGIEGGRYGYYWYGYERVMWKNSFDIIDNNCIKLRNTPSVDEPNGLRVFVTLLPKACINTVPRSIALPFGQNIGRGVVADLLCIPNKEWTNPNLARKYELDYERMMLSARAVASSNRKIDNNNMLPIRIL